MSISGVTSYTRFAQPADLIQRHRPAGPSFAQALNDAAGSRNQNSAQAVGTADFTHMTRQGLIDWVNEKIKSGELSLDGTESFVSMTIRIPIDGSDAGLDDQEHVNFVRMAQDGMAWARQNHATDMLKSLQAALNTMHKYQQNAAV